ncbi:MAG: hypothetical protein L3K19_08970 [Thermoplasmata archaeon]|nr:hypothetical protein [Thermoplasmata archaeon]
MGSRAMLPGGSMVILALLVAFPSVGFIHGIAPPSQLVAPPPSLAAGLAPNAQACNRSAPNASDPSGVHGMFVLEPPLKPQGLGYSDMTRYLINNSLVCGADFWVHWSDVDQGPTAHPRYNWTGVLQAIRPWEQAGKLVNLIFWAIGYGRTASYIPSYVLAQIPTIQCGKSPVTPLFWNDTYVRDYRAFMRAAVSQFNTDPSVGYLRFGFGTGGETLPLLDGDELVCKAKLFAAGYSIPVWDSYLLSMIDYEHSMSSTHPFLVALDGALGPRTDDTFADIGGRASRDGVGFGTEALVNSSATWNATTGLASCVGGGFCMLFNRFQGRVPLEVQTIGPSSPNGSGPVGSLVPLLSYSLQEHAQVYEIYFSDWLTAFDPNSPNYAAYHSVYEPAFKAVGRVVG